MAERQIATSIIEWLHSQGCYALKIHGHPMQEAGIPDILFCWGGRFGAIEVKMPGQHPTPLQRYHLKLIREAGGIAFVAHSLDEAKAGLERRVWDEEEAP